jgi:hypothetical protein
MAQCDVFVYDSRLAALGSGSTIEILEIDDSGKNLDYQIGQAFNPTEFGAKITLPVVHQPIDVLVDDTTGALGPASLCQLNSKLTARLDVVLYAVPVGSAGGGGGGSGDKLTLHVPVDPYPLAEVFDVLDKPSLAFGGIDPVQTPSAIASFIQHQFAYQRWSEEEAAGVRSLVETSMRFLNRSNPSHQLRHKLETWLDLLRDLGIDMSQAVKQKQKRSGGSSQQGGSQINRGGLLEAGP